MGCMLETRGAHQEVRPRRDAQTAVDGACLHVEEGLACTGLLGPNGAGKSTVLKMVCGMMRPTEGEILVDGHPGGATTSYRIGSLIEEAPLYPQPHGAREPPRAHDDAGPA